MARADGGVVLLHMKSSGVGLPSGGTAGEDCADVSGAKNAAGDNVRELIRTKSSIAR